jgi:hypothetical protein
MIGTNNYFRTALFLFGLVMLIISVSQPANGSSTGTDVSGDIFQPFHVGQE